MLHWPFPPPSPLSAGTATLRTLDEDDYILSGPARLTTSTAGLVGSTGEIAGRESGIREGSITIRIRVLEGRQLFLGVASRQDLDAYLGTARHEILDDIRYDPLEARRTAVGAAALLPPPAGAVPWVASVSGDAPLDLAWQPENGDFAFAILRSDGQPGIDVTLEFGTKFRYQRGFAIAGIAIGAILILVGLLVAVLGIRRRRPSPPAPGMSPLS
ncbi:MAG: hypothetical protein KatS3mg062_1410 [Tepidiforma sp.]|nr:MAG: hypothetical protein KatS3mg062_1410 [Tepidiforma sp.]